MSTSESFDESLISGYLDGELTQAERQRVRLQLERSSEARELFNEMKEMRQVTLSTSFMLPDDTQWNETPRGFLSQLTHHAGWLLLSGWGLAVGLFALWQAATSPENLLFKLTLFGGLAGLGLLFVSVLMDRLRVRPTDRYRRVLK